MMVIDPENPDHHEAEGIGYQIGKDPMQIVLKQPHRIRLSGNVRDLYGKHHNGDNDGDDSITKCFYSAGAYFHFNKSDSTNKISSQFCKNPGGIFFFRALVKRMRDWLRVLLAGYGAKKLGGGCLSTIVIFLVLYWLLGQHC